MKQSRLCHLHAVSSGSAMPRLFCLWLQSWASSMSLSPRSMAVVNIWVLRVLNRDCDVFNWRTYRCGTSSVPHTSSPSVQTSPSISSIVLLLVVSVLVCVPNSLPSRISISSDLLGQSVGERFITTMLTLRPIIVLTVYISSALLRYNFPLLQL